MECLRCGNRDESRFYFDGKVYYCRNCIAFGRIDVGSVPICRLVKPPVKKHRYKVKLDFALTDHQQRVSDQIVEYLKQGKDVLCFAVCGAGKTEIAMQAICNALNKGLKVGFAIPRRQVVLEIAQRMAKAFPKAKVIQVCEGYNDELIGDLTVCTMHQLYRYPHYFDFLIMDEIDAFPYKNNPLLKRLAMDSCDGRRLMLTATPSDDDLQACERGELCLVELFERPHGHALVEPTMIRLPVSLQLWHSLRYILKNPHPVLIFTPTIAQAELYARIFSLFFKCSVVTSKTEDKDGRILALKRGELDFLFTTTILERGITIYGVDVIILQSDHPVFDAPSLIQIIGRVGRSKDCPSGLGIFYCEQYSQGIKQCRRILKQINEKRMSAML